GDTSLGTSCTPCQIPLPFVARTLSSFFFFSSRRRHTRFSRDWSSDVCSSDLPEFRWKYPRALFSPKLGIIKPETAPDDSGKKANGNPIGVGTSAITILVTPVTIFLLGTSFSFRVLK